MKLKKLLEILKEFPDDYEVHVTAHDGMGGSVTLENIKELDDKVVLLFNDGASPVST